MTRKADEVRLVATGDVVPDLDLTAPRAKSVVPDLDATKARARPADPQTGPPAPRSRAPAARPEVIAKPRAPRRRGWWRARQADSELAAARAEIVRLEQTVKEQAIELSMLRKRQRSG